MNAFAKLLFIGAFVLPTICHSQQDRPASADTQPDGMVSIVNAVAIAGDRQAVFDLITTARFWPLWHPASMLVGGVTERPYRLGDRIRERGQVATQAFQVTWTVAEHERPSHVVLESEDSSVRITYAFKSGEEATVFMRKLQYNAQDLAVSDFTPDELNRAMRLQSEQAVNQLKAFVEKILRTEKLGLD